MKSAYDERGWMLDELLVQADDAVSEMFATRMMQQADEIRRTLKQLAELKQSVDLAPLDRWAVTKAEVALRAHLVRLRDEK
jgi:hypothetical protein